MQIELSLAISAGAGEPDVLPLLRLSYFSCMYGPGAFCKLFFDGDMKRSACMYTACRWARRNMPAALMRSAHPVLSKLKTWTRRYSRHENQVSGCWSDQFRHHFQKASQTDAG